MLPSVSLLLLPHRLLFFFFFNDTAPTEIYTLSLHDALPIGFDPTRERQGAAFLSSGRYHHHLGLNIWQSAGAGRRDDKATGLAWFSLEIERPDLFDAQEERLRKAGSDIVTLTNGIEVSDP